jgi:hypothetical protein
MDGGITFIRTLFQLKKISRMLSVKLKMAASVGKFRFWRTSIVIWHLTASDDNSIINSI